MSTTALKLVALALMLLDHIHQFIPGIPMVFTWLGRLSAPLFVFACVWGIYHTHNRLHYLTRLYLWGVAMSVGDWVITALCPTGYGTPFNNIFVTLFLIAFVVTLLECYQKKQWKQANLLLALLIVCQVAGQLAVSLLMHQLSPDGALLDVLPGNPYLLAIIPAAIFPNLLFCEGGIFFVALGVALYFCRNSKKTLSVVYVAFCALFFFFAFREPYVENLFYGNFQWMMLAALPLMLCYNGQPGRGYRRLFYVFYPAHIFVLYVLGSFLR
ncbi:MAG: TraX family protein [Oscillospiraceae bacterium]